MSIAFTTTSRAVRNGVIELRGTVSITSSAAGGETFSPNDVESGLSRVELMKIASSGSDHFAVTRTSDEELIVRPIDPSLDLTVKSGVTAAALAFYCRGTI